MAEKKNLKHVVFFHPDLGIGGAERLVIDAAVGLQNRGHKVTIYTSHCNPQHCFEEARDGTLDVRVRGNTIFPASILSRFTIICAILRQLHLIFSIYISSELSRLKPDAFFVDQLSAGLPVLRYLYPSQRVLFYCHFPDLLLAQGRTKWLKRVYRVPFDWLEQWSMSFADAIAVNSKFTMGVVSKVWPQLTQEKELQVVYPCVDTKEDKHAREDKTLIWRDIDVLLSINRYEEKKNIELAIRAFAGLGKVSRTGVRLVVAGGYDHRVQENVVYHNELSKLATSLNLKCMTAKNVVTALGVSEEVDVLFLLSVPGTLKDALLRSARLLVYTPSNEHFGIVPLEAMLAGTPILAANTGGPLETVLEGATGWLRSPEDIPEWTLVMDRVLHKISKSDLHKIGQAGKARVKKEFSDAKMAERLERIFIGIEEAPRASTKGITICIFGVGMLPVLAGLVVTFAQRLFQEV